jgi:hypothetical protein
MRRERREEGRSGRDMGGRRGKDLGGRTEQELGKRRGEQRRAEESRGEERQNAQKQRSCEPWQEGKIGFHKNGGALKCRDHSTGKHGELQ